MSPEEIESKRLRKANTRSPEDLERLTKESPYLWYSDVPDNTEPGIPIIVVTRDYRKAQVTIRNKVAFHWEYMDTEKVFCRADEIWVWRHCGGFDF